MNGIPFQVMEFFWPLFMNGIGSHVNNKHSGPALFVAMMNQVFNVLLIGLIALYRVNHRIRMNRLLLKHRLSAGQLIAISSGYEYLFGTGLKQLRCTGKPYTTAGTGN